MPLTETLKPLEFSDTRELNAPGSARRSLEESVMYVVGLICAVVVTGFALYRWQTGEYRGAILNICIVATVSVPMLLGLSQRFRHVALNMFGSTISAGCLISALYVSNNGLLWALMVILVNSLTLSRKWALGLSTLVIVVLSGSTHIYISPLHHVSWTIVALLICSFSLITMEQLRTQRQLLATQANVDPLTGVGNRRLMQQQLQDIVTERRKDRSHGTLMVLDIDHFKKINDNHGHEVGDQVLVEVTRSVAGALRSEDDLYRMGGEEFVILFRGMDAATALSDLPTLHHRLSGLVSTPDGPVSFSAGVATLHKGEDWSQWLARADSALYKAKGQGRNQLLFGEE